VSAAVSFDAAVDRALGGVKYNVLTGRTMDFKDRAANLAGRFVEKYILPLFNRIPPLTGGGAGAGVLYFIFVMAGLAVVSAAVYFLVANLRKRPVKKTVAEIFNGIVTANETAGSLLTKATAAAGAGNCRESVRFAYIALLIAFDNKKYIVLRDSKTNGQLAREVKASAPEVYENFGSIAAAFDYFWFGNKDIGAEDCDANLSAVAGLIGRNRAGAAV